MYTFLFDFQIFICEEKKYLICVKKCTLTRDSDELTNFLAWYLTKLFRSTNWVTCSIFKFQKTYGMQKFDRNQSGATVEVGGC